jgi:prepilin-type N-terminal cleavage/methylation domain-containing protein
MVRLSIWIGLIFFSVRSEYPFSLASRYDCGSMGFDWHFYFVTISSMANDKKTSPSRKFKGFTLVELIVVITILAILGTIGFLAIGGYSSKARDSARIGDLAQVSKSLDLSQVVSGSYPVPDNSFPVTYSGGVIWNQGTV